MTGYCFPSVSYLFLSVSYLFPLLTISRSSAGYSALFSARWVPIWEMYHLLLLLGFWFMPHWRFSGEWQQLYSCNLNCILVKSPGNFFSNIVVALVFRVSMYRSSKSLPDSSWGSACFFIIISTPLLFHLITKCSSGFLDLCQNDSSPFLLGRQMPCQYSLFCSPLHISLTWPVLCSSWAKQSCSSESGEKLFPLMLVKLKVIFGVLNLGTSAFSFSLGFLLVQNESPPATWWSQRIKAAVFF